MIATEQWRQAAKALRANWLRAALTALGIVIGVASLVDLTAVSAGARAGVADDLNRLGPNIVIVDGELLSSGAGHSAGSDRTLSPADIEALGQLPAVTAAAPHQALDLTISSGRSQAATPVIGVTRAFEAIHNYTVKAGRLLTGSDERFGSSVIVLGEKPLAKLFASPAAAIGRTVRINDQELTVIGALAHKGKLGQDDLDNQALVPLSLAKRTILGGENIRSVDVQVRSDQLIQATQDNMTALLRARHNLPAASADDFSMEDQASLIKASQSATSIFRTLTIALGAIAMLVGGIGIMNIMLVSVTERTREIGIRKAVGAPPSVIRRQFLIEASMLSVLGGIAGAVLGLATAGLLDTFAGLRTIVAPASIAIAVASAVTVGLFFGYYPARRAAALDPLEALRAD